ncbi:MAG: hypothetical protein ABUL73_06505 [Alphaproteobacteria bacterium]
MNTDLLISFAKIVGSVILLGAVLYTVARLSKRFHVEPELARKLIHVSLGLYCLLFPYIFRYSWEVAATCALAVAVFALARGKMRASLGEGLHSVSRVSYGEILFAISVALLFELKGGHYVLNGQGRVAQSAVILYTVPLLILTLCDAAAALVGASYGRRTFHVEEGIKSWEGVAVFVITAWLVSLIALLTLSNIDRNDAILIALMLALFGALFEAASWRGLDNLFIPLGLYFVLATMTGKGTIGLITAAAAFILLSTMLWALGERLKISRHWTATAAVLLFCIATFSGVMSTLAPITAAVAYGFASRKGRIERPPYDALNFLLTSLLIALSFFLVSDFLRIDTIFGFNLAFACLAAGVVGRSGRGFVAILIACIAAWCAMAVRTLWIAGIDHRTLLFAVGAACAIIASGLAGWAVTRDGSDRPWFSLGGLSVLIGFASLMFAPT